MVITEKPDVHAFYLPEFSRRVQVRVVPWGDLTPERFVQIAKTRNARIGSITSESSHRTGFAWWPVWYAKWEEGGCEMEFGGVPCPDDEMRRLRREVSGE